MISATKVKTRSNLTKFVLYQTVLRVMLEEFHCASVGNLIYCRSVHTAAFSRILVSWWDLTKKWQIWLFWNLSLLFRVLFGSRTMFLTFFRLKSENREKNWLCKRKMTKWMANFSEKKWTKNENLHVDKFEFSQKDISRQNLWQQFDKIQVF